MIRWAARILLLVFLLLIFAVAALAFMPTRWLADKAETIGSDALNASLSIGRLDLDVFSLTPSVKLTDTTLREASGGTNMAAFDVALISGSVDLGRLLRGDLVIDEIVVDNVDVNLEVDERGESNWSYLMSPPSETENTDASEPIAIPAIRNIDIQNVNIVFNDRQNDRQADLSVATSGSTIKRDQPTKISAVGTINGLDSTLDAEFMPLASISIPPEAISLVVKSRLGGSAIALDGKIGDLVNLKKLDLTFSVEGQGLEDFAVLSGITLPVLPPFSLTGDVRRDDEEFVLRRFDGVLGDSDIEGDIRMNPSTSPTTLYANVISRSLDLDDLAGLLGGTPDTNETVTSAQQEDATDEPNDTQLLPDNELALRPLIGLFNGAVEYRADSVKSSVWPVDSIDVRVDISGDNVVLSPLNLGIAGGLLAGSVTADMATQPMKSQLDINIKRVDIKQVLSSLGVDDDSFGILGGRLKFWVEGETVANMAASADGGMFLLMTEGRLDALLTELAGIDLTESLILLIDPEKTRTDINCAYLDIHSKNGVTEIATLVLDTDDSVILGTGTINLNDESLDLTVEPHPKDTSILAAQTAAYIGGTFTNLTVRPGKTLYARVAAAAVLAAIATPAAALIPFIEAGTGQSSPYCTGMVTALDEER